MKIKPIHIFLILSVLFLLFSLSIYSGTPRIETYTELDKSEVAEGRLVWQKYNCANCHQLYGLGGHLGPDLTNEYSKLDGNVKALRIYFDGGMKQMPKLKLSEREKDALVVFLKATDATGSADPQTYKRLMNGMIEQNDER